MATLTPKEVSELQLIGKETIGGDWRDEIYALMNDLSEEIRASFVKEHDSRQLLQDITALPAEKTNTGYSFKITFDKDGIINNLEQGVKGSQSTYPGVTNKGMGFTTKKPPPLIEWARSKGKPLSFAYAVRESIFKKGIKPSKFYSKVVTERRKQQMSDDIAKVTKDQILASIRANL